MMKPLNECQGDRKDRPYYIRLTFSHGNRLAEPPRVW